MRYHPPHLVADERFISNSSISWLNSLSYLDKRIYLRTVPNSYPRFLYKYIYPHQDRDQILESYFINSVIPLKSATSFNDPFDAAMRVVMDGTIQEKRKLYKDIVRSVHPEFTRRKLEYETTRVMTDTRGTIEHMAEVHKKNIDAMGVSCFSQNPRNILLWSHYAFHYKGFALQFEIAKDPRSLLKAFPVAYKKHYPVLNLLKNGNDTIKYATEVSPLEI